MPRLRRPRDVAGMEGNKEMKKFTYKYWFAGMKRPSKLPKGCEVRIGNKWSRNVAEVHKWDYLPHRWKVEVKTCKKWYRKDDNIPADYHGVYSGYVPKYCEKCSKPVEIVKGSKTK